MYLFTHHDFSFNLIIQCLKPRAISCPHQPPTTGDTTVSEAKPETPVCYSILNFLNTNNSIYHKTFVCTQLKGASYYYFPTIFNN